jgi:hypothetical protein
MITKVVPINEVNYSEYLYIQRNNTLNNQPLTGLGFSSAGLKAYYCRRDNAGVGITLRSISAGDPWLSGGFVELDSTNLPGYYRLDIPNEVFSSGYVEDITNLIISGASNMAPTVLNYQIKPSVTISSAGVYNRILSANEVRVNYAALRGRFESGPTYVTLGTVGNPAKSGYTLKQQSPDLPSGYYYIKNANMPNTLYMYVDMTNDGGGYDFYVIDNGITVNSVTQTNSGTVLGLDLIYPRSQAHWKAVYEFTQNVLGVSYGTYMNHCGAIYNTIASNYTSQIMRDPTYYGSGATGWRVPDGGRWWIRDTTYGEPNGNYTPLGFLFLQGLSSTGLISAFDDGGAPYTGSKYLVSTNAKP